MDNQFKKKKIQNAEWVGRSTSKKSIFKFGQIWPKFGNFGQ